MSHRSLRAPFSVSLDDETIFVEDFRHRRRDSFHWHGYHFGIRRAFAGSASSRRSAVPIRFSVLEGLGVDLEPIMDGIVVTLLPQCRSARPSFVVTGGGRTSRFHRATHKASSCQTI